METHELLEKLKKMSDRSHLLWEKSLGKQGGETAQSHFYWGEHAILDNLIYAIENDDLKYLDPWTDQ